MSNNYILVIEASYPYDTEQFKSKLNLAIDWLQIVPDVYFIESTSDTEKWYDRLKPVLDRNRFFMTRVNISSGEYTGWLAKNKWEWIRNKKK